MPSVIFMSYHKQHVPLITDMHFGPLLWHIKTFSLFLVNRLLSSLKILQHFITSSTWMFITQPPWALITNLPTLAAGSVVLGGSGVCTSQTSREWETSTDLGMTTAAGELLAHCPPPPPHPTPSHPHPPPKKISDPRHLRACLCMTIDRFSPCATEFCTASVALLPALSKCP